MRNCSGDRAAILVAVVTVMAGVWIFALLGDEVLEGGTQAFDRKVLLSMRRAPDLGPIGPQAVQDGARDVTALGSVTTLGLVAAITAGFFALAGKNRMAVFVCAATISGVLVSTLLKSSFDRARPDLVPHGFHLSEGSFPSGHSMMSAVVYLTIGALLAQSQERRRLKIYFLLVAVVITLTVGVSRVYLGVHWPTDVLAGWVAGTMWAVLCWLVARRLQKPGLI